MSALKPFRIAAEGERVRLVTGEPELQLFRRTDGARCGSGIVEREGAAVIIRSLCVEAPFRGYGLGSEAARLIREQAESQGATILRAWAPQELGLAAYFWSRMGLRPLHGAGPSGGIWFERLLPPSGTGQPG